MLFPYSSERAARIKTLWQVVRGISKKILAVLQTNEDITYLLEAGYDIRTVQELFGHSDVRTTMIYTHVLNPRRPWCAEPGGSAAQGSRRFMLGRMG